MVCKQCGCDIPRGTKFQQTKYKSISFCSEECFNAYNQNREPAPQRQLTDYIQAISDVPPNWAYLIRQSKAIEQNYGLDQKQQLLVIRFAVEFEGAEFMAQYGLGQFFPKYIQPYQKFVDELKSSHDAARDMQPDIVNKIKPHRQVARMKQEELEF